MTKCPFVIQLWQALQPSLLLILNTPLSYMELCFGLSGSTPPVLFRNWMTYLLRDCISTFERMAYHNGRGMQNLHPFKAYYNSKFYHGVTYWLYYFTQLGREDIFLTRFPFSDALLSKLPDGRLQITEPFPLSDDSDESSDSDSDL